MKNDHEEFLTFSFPRSAGKKKRHHIAAAIEIEGKIFL